MTTLPPEMIALMTEFRFTRHKPNDDKMWRRADEHGEVWANFMCAPDDSNLLQGRPDMVSFEFTYADSDYDQVCDPTLADVRIALTFVEWVACQPFGELQNPFHPWSIADDATTD